MQQRAFMKFFGGAILFLSCHTLVPAAVGEEINAVYRASYAGLPAGEVRIRFAGDAATYRDEIMVESLGLPRLITRFRATAVGEGGLAADGHAVPLRYDALYDLRKRHDSHISLRFVNGDGAVIAERDTADTSRKPPLSDLYRRNVVDPISAMAAIRNGLRTRRSAATTDFAVPVYDGTRRFDVLVHVVSEGKKEGVIRLQLTLQPIAGFRGESSEDGDPDDAPRQVETVFTDDANLVPISMQVLVWYLPLVVRFEHFCKSFETCDKSGH